MEEGPQCKPSTGPSIVEELLRRTRHFMAAAIADCVRRYADVLLRWILGRAVRHLISASLFIMAAGFLLLGGSEGLIVSGMPRYLAHLAVGAASLLAGLVVLKGFLPSGRN